MIKFISALAIMGDSDKEKKLAMFILMMTIFTILTFCLMYYYWKKSHQWRHKEHSHDMKFMDSDIAMHAIMVKGLNGGIPADQMQEILKRTFEKLLPGPKVIACKVEPNLNDLYDLAKKLREYKRNYR